MPQYSIRFDLADGLDVYVVSAAGVRPNDPGTADAIHGTHQIALVVDLIVAHSRAEAIGTFIEDHPFTREFPWQSDEVQATLLRDAAAILDCATVISDGAIK